MSEWARIVSWHLLSGVTSRGGMLRTLCGKWADQNAPTVAEPPVNERTCERCFQLREHAK